MGGDGADVRRRGREMTKRRAKAESGRAALIAEDKKKRRLKVAAPGFGVRRPTRGMTSDVSARPYVPLAIQEPTAAPVRRTREGSNAHLTPMRVRAQQVMLRSASMARGGGGAGFGDGAPLYGGPTPPHYAHFYTREAPAALLRAIERAVRGRARAAPQMKHSKCGQRLRILVVSVVPDRGCGRVSVVVVVGGVGGIWW